MKNFLKSGLKRTIAGSVSAISRTTAGRYLYAQVVTISMDRSRKVTHHGVELRFAVPNAQNDWRVETFATKEPETLQWIDGIPRGSVVWDIGANVGLYTCYAAKARDCAVFAFEPSVFNLELLARNIFLNDLVSRVTIVPLALSDQLAVSTLRVSSTDWGGALSTFGQDYGQDGQPLTTIFEFSTLGLSMADAASSLRIPPPDYIKLDVDGIEHLILRGGVEILGAVEGILIEINDNFAEQARGCAESLRHAGLTLVEKSHSEIVEESEFRSAFNQIWMRECEPGLVSRRS